MPPLTTTETLPYTGQRWESREHPSIVIDVIGVVNRRGAIHVVYGYENTGSVMAVPLGSFNLAYVPVSPLAQVVSIASAAGVSTETQA